MRGFPLYTEREKSLGSPVIASGRRIILGLSHIHLRVLVKGYLNKKYGYSSSLLGCKEN